VVLLIMKNFQKQMLPECAATAPPKQHQR